MEQQARQYTNEASTANLQKEMIQTEETLKHLDRQIARDKRQINDIEQSNTWKMTAIFRSMKQFFLKLFGAQDKQTIKQLEMRLAEKERELNELKEETYEKQLLDHQITEAEIIDSFRSLKDSGKLLNYLDTYIEQKQQIQQNYRKALTYGARLYMNNDEAERNLVYSKILPSLHNEEIPEFMIRAGLDEQPLPLQQVASFRGSLNMRMRQKQLNGTLPEWPLDDKRLAYNFSKQLNLTIPKIDEQTYTKETIPLKADTVIKPVDGAGSRGVYLVHGENDIYDVKQSEQLDHWDAFMRAIEDDLQTGAVANDQWMVEQLIYENRYEKSPARDMKFYCFYGKVGIILEIIREPEVRQCWWTADGKRISTEKYDETLFKGIGVTDEELNMVSELSAKIPAPFIRIDFLKGEDGLVFGEFTPKPGNYDEFDEKTDKDLGDYFIEAQGRLINDLLEGKEFVEYREFFEKQHEMSP